ncbi:hypothetical protein H8Z72_22675 (plasmid) [Xanthomonas citri pv. citri]|uniref:hypothetical protein n=1 Tax=Xanthomonas citri TaxID=346 RepID=UPI001933A493|nr:hypothetical protein [Xanthomonas citri]QRD67200.1 hypothetical protein H8Z73_22490 [Xanthomonas citri pv. citri]QRD71755.1 hypothetical protein H8Z72_22675 [Xanthomonas citri pv. citri]
MAVRKRLALVWPDVMALDEDDRKLLAVLASECGLADVVAAREQTILCLRRAARDPLQRAPAGRDGVSPPVALELLLHDAAPAPAPES